MTAVGLAQQRRLGALESVSAGGVPHVAQVTTRQPGEPMIPEGELPPELAFPRGPEGLSALDAGVAGPAMMP